jgi:hypothetical protein
LSLVERATRLSPPFEWTAKFCHPINPLARNFFILKSCHPINGLPTQWAEFTSILPPVNILKPPPFIFFLK